MHSTTTLGHGNPHLRWQVLVFVVVVVAFLYLAGQLTAPFIAGDDWGALLPASQQGGTALPWANTLEDGRWINYLWYLVSVHFSPLGSNALFTMAYLAVSGAIASLVVDKRLFILCALAVFFSPMLSELSLWPTTLFISVALCTVAITILATCSERAILPVVFVSTFALVMAYPPLASVVLIGAAARQSKPTVKPTVLIAVAFLVAFAVSVLVSFALNAWLHGHFGVVVAKWRTPHPLRGVGDLGANLRIAATNWFAIGQRYKVPIVCTVVAAALVLSRRETRPRGLALIFALVICCCVDLGITVIAGVGNPGRTYVWLWVAACLLCALAASQGVALYRYSGIALLVALTVYGATFAWHNYRTYRPIVTYISTLGQAVRAHWNTAPHTTIVLAGSLMRVPMNDPWLPGGHWPMPEIGWALWKEYGVHIQRCDYSNCVMAMEYAATHRLSVPTLQAVGARLFLILNAGDADEILRVYPSARTEEAMHLGYPTFLRYGPTFVRVTPFAPGTSGVPVSISLPATTSGFVLQLSAGACAYPVDYRLMDVETLKSTTGRYNEHGPMFIPGSNEGKGVALLSLQMARGAKNNYNCNIVVSPAHG